jgi:capsular exopolysaccharide synthesis family protein
MSDEVPQNRAAGWLPDRKPVEGLDLKHYLTIIRRRIWVIVPVMVIVATLGILRTFRAVPVYEAEARLLIEREYPRIMGFEDSYQLDWLYDETQRELVTSRPVMEAALEQPGVRSLLEGRGEGPVEGGGKSILGELRRTIAAVMGTAPTAPPELWEVLRGFVDVRQVPETHLLAVKVRDSDPRRAAAIANAVVVAFVQHHLEDRRANSSDVFDFLQVQKEREEERLLAAEAALQAFREQTKVVSLDVSDRTNPVLVRQSRLNDQLTEVQLKRIELEARARVVRGAMGAGMDVVAEAAFSLPEVQADPIITGLRSQMLQVQQESAALFETYGPRHPRYVAAREELDVLEEQLTAALPRVAATIDDQLAMLRHEEDELRKEYETQTEAALDLSEQSLVYDRLVSDVARRRQLFDVLVERLRELDLADDYAKTNVEVAETAEVPRVAMGPRKARGAFLAVFVGLFLGLGCAFLLEYLDDTVKTPEDLTERTGIPALGFVPDIRTGRGKRGDLFARRSRVCMDEPTSSITEAYRSIRTSLFFSAPEEQTRVVVVTSADRGEGKSTTAANLAAVMAQSGKNVLLVDADCRRPRMHSVFGLSGRAGLTSVLVGQAALEDAVQQPQDEEGTPVENLHVLPAGPVPPNPAELLGSPQMRDMLETARRRYDRVLIDSPPVLFVADACILSAICDGVVLVVKSAKNSRSLTRRAREQLLSVNAHILGGVLNAVHLGRLGRYSGYYQYGYAGYYEESPETYPEDEGQV